MNNSQYPVARKSGLVIQELPDEVLVYDLNSNKAHCLNQTASMVWKSCDGKTSISQMAEAFGSDNNEDLVWLAIDQLGESELLEKAVESKFHGQSRREVIKKIGLASIIAVPVIASLVAPQNALASTSCACLGPGDCLTQPSCPSTTNCAPSGSCAP